MSITKERFQQGMTYDDYKAQMTRNQDRLIENEEQTTIGEADLAWFTQQPAVVNVAVLTEDWCGDAIAALPVLARLAAESNKLNLRIFLRDQNLDIMDQYLKEGLYRSIPVFIFIDQAFNELGHFIERPASVTESLSTMRQKLFDSEEVFTNIAIDTDFGELPESARNRLIEVMGAYRLENRGLINGAIVREVRKVIED